MEDMDSPLQLNLYSCLVVWEVTVLENWVSKHPLPPSLPLFFSALSAFLTFSSFPALLLFYTLPPSSLSPLIILVCDNTCNGLG